MGSRMDALQEYQYGSQSIPLFRTHPQTRLQNQYGGLASLSAKHFPQKFLDEDALNPSFSRYSCRNFSMKTALRASFHLVPCKLRLRAAPGSFLRELAVPDGREHADVRARQRLQEPGAPSRGPASARRRQIAPAPALPEPTAEPTTNHQSNRYPTRLYLGDHCI